MNLSQELQNLNNRLDKCQRKLAAAKIRRDDAIALQFLKEIGELKHKIEQIKGQQHRALSDKGEKIKAMPFHRALTKLEQADMGKLKKSVRGLVVVHPMTAQGKELGLSEVTGYAHKKF